MLPFRRLYLGLALLGSARVTNALSQTYCSSENTGSDFSVVTDIYQSNGACSTTCSGEYAFAIVQWQSCWCSNYIPSSQDDVSNCSQNCPGFPSEQCGDEDSGLFGYIQLAKSPSGTAGAGAVVVSSSSSERQQTSTIIVASPTPSPTTQEQETSIVSSTVVQTVTQSVSQIIQTTQTSEAIATSQPPPPPPTTSSTRTTPTSTSRPPQTTASATPVTSIIETTVSGEIVTRTVTSTPTVVVGNASNDKVDISRSDGLSGGAVAGIVIGVVAGLAILAIAAFLLWRRKKTDETAAAAGGSKKNMTRNVSVLSKAGLLSRGAQPSMGERDQDDAYTANGSNSVRHSMLFGPGAEGVSPASPLGSSHGESSSSRRPSKPMVYDQRLNPSVLFSNSEANGSRISMQDTQDYSRPLGIANPDPRPSFESRKSNYRA